MHVRTLCLVLLILSAADCRDARPIRLATTTSVENSGLLEPLLNAFEHESGLPVDSLAVGSGKAMTMVKRGDADLMITHDPAGERAFIEDQNPILYRKLMCGDFVLAGPPADPAGVRDSDSAEDAMRRIRSSDARFASRGDRSGTHVREIRLWELAGGAPEASRLLETGQGMASTLRVASERQAYALTDRATFLQLRDSLDLAIHFEARDPELLNCYAVTVARGPRQQRARQLAEWLTRGGGRDRIGTFVIEGEPAFRVWPGGVPDGRPEDLPR